MRSLVAAALALPFIKASSDAEVGGTVKQSSSWSLRRRLRLEKFVTKVTFAEHEVDNIWQEIDLDKVKKADPEDVRPVDLPEQEDDFVCETAGDYCENKHSCDNYTRLHETRMGLNYESKMNCYCQHAWSYEDDYCDKTKGFDPINCDCGDSEEDDMARDDVELNDPENLQKDMVLACVRYSLDEGEYEWITEQMSKKKYANIVVSDEDAVRPEACTVYFEDCDPSGIVCAEKANVQPDNEEKADSDEADENKTDEADEADTNLDKEIKVEERLSAEIEELEAKIHQLESMLDEDNDRR